MDRLPWSILWSMSRPNFRLLDWFQKCLFRYFENNLVAIERMTQFQRPNFQRNRQKAYAEERQPTSRTTNEIQLPKCPSFGIKKYRCCRPNVRSGLIFYSVESCSSPSFDNKKTMIVSILCFVFIGGVIGISIYSAHQFYQATSFPRTVPK